MATPKALRPRLTLVGLAALAALIVLLALAGTSEARTVLSAGHIDGINPVLTDGELAVTVRDDTNPPNDVIREVDDVLIHGGTIHRRNIPGSGFYDFGFLAHASGQFWQLPATSQPGKLFLGWGTENPSLRDGGASKFDGPLTYSLVGYEGPGYFHLYQLGDDDLEMLASSENLPGVTNSWTEPIPTHVHANWAFSEPGVHKLKFRVRGTLTGGQVVSDTQEYRFFIGEPTGIGVGELPDLNVDALDQRHAIGSQVTLVAAQTPATTQDHYHWFKRCEGSWEYINPSLTETLELTVTEELVGCEIQARLYDGEHVVIATSTPKVLKSNLPTMTVTGLKHHYHVGDQLELGLNFDPAEGHPHVHWFQKVPGGDWQEIGGGVTLTKTLALADNGSQIKAVQGHGEESYESDLVTISVEDHASHEPTLTITGLKDHYHAGDQLDLGLSFDPVEDHPHVHWFQKSGAGEWAEIGGGVNLSKTLALSDDGSHIKAVQGHDGESYESAPVTLHVEDHGDGHEELSAKLKPVGPKRFRQVRRQKAVKVKVTANQAGKANVKASISGKAARRIGLKAPRKVKQVIVGAVQVQRQADQSTPVKVRLKPRFLSRLKGARGSLSIRLNLRFKGDEGQSVSRTATLKIRR